MPFKHPLSPIRAFTGFTAAVCCLIASTLPSRAQTHYQLGPDSQAHPGVPKGEMLHFDLTESRLYPGTHRTVWVYVPAQYKPEKPACLCVGLDGPGFNPQTVFDNLIARGEMPLTIGVFISSGTVSKAGAGDLRYDRCFEFDSTNGRFDQYLFSELLPAVCTHKTTDGRAIRLSEDPNDHMIYGGSSGGVCAFTAAWFHPDRFRRVFTAIGTYVGMRGADQYPTLVRKTEPKPIRIFQQDGAQDTWNPLFDNWYTQNRSMEESLNWAGYDVNHSWGTLGHEGSHADSLFPDVVKWLWRDYPQPITAGVSPNSMLQSILVPSKGWEALPTGTRDPRCLTANPKGDVYLFDAGQAGIYKLDPSGNGQPQPLPIHNARIDSLAFSPNGNLYIALADGNLATLDTDGFLHGIARNLGRVGGLYVASDGAVYASVEATGNGPKTVRNAPAHEARAILRIAANGKRTILDTARQIPAGLLLTPDHNLLFAAEGGTHWIDSYVVAADGSLQDRQRFYWLHSADSSQDPDGPDSDDGAGATDLAEDKAGNLYVATRLGVQVCDRNGRVEGILTLPDGPVTSLTFGGPNFDQLYVVCGGKIYRRPLKVAGVPCWAPPQPLPGFGGG